MCVVGKNATYRASRCDQNTEIEAVGFLIFEVNVQASACAEVDCGYVVTMDATEKCAIVADAEIKAIDCVALWPRCRPAQRRILMLMPFFLWMKNAKQHAVEEFKDRFRLYLCVRRKRG